MVLKFYFGHPENQNSTAAYLDLTNVYYEVHFDCPNRFSFSIVSNNNNVNVFQFFGGNKYYYFKTKLDVEKLIEDIIINNLNDYLTIYDLESKIIELGLNRC